MWDNKKEKWYFSVIDIVAVLTEQNDFKKAQSYWTTLKNRKEERKIDFFLHKVRNILHSMTS